MGEIWDCYGSAGLLGGKNYRKEFDQNGPIWQKVAIVAIGVV